MDGFVRNIEYQKGTHRPAFMKRACKNQQNRMHLETDDGEMELRQITGTLVRKIVCYVGPGDWVSRGERIGMIRFGSRVEVSIPNGYSLQVELGDKVRAGETVVAVRSSWNVFRVIRLPDLFTLLNVVFGFLALLAAGRAWGGNFPQYAVVFILLAAMADGLDGFLARKVGGSPLGANLDSLADLISFGTAPVFLAISAFHLPPHIWPVGIFFLLCGTLRLARFNVVSGKSDQFFEGLPIPAAGIALSASVLFG